MASTIDFGIDLGTTNSTIACCRQGDVRVFQSTDLMNVTPSVVYVSKSGRMLVGKKAYDAWIADPANTQAEFKRWMGYSDRLTFPASGKSLSSEELSAEVLKALRADVQRQNAEDVTCAVITVPAAFGSLQCEATGKATKLAGLEDAPLLQEPIAAAIAHGADPASANQRCMVFDLGGGTLDIAVVSTRNGRLAVLEHQGDNRLGGKDIDRTIAEAFLLPALTAGFSMPARNIDPAAFDRLMRILFRHAEQAKIALSTAPQVTVELFDLGNDADGKPIEATINLTRGEVEAKIEPLIERCIKLAERALDGARVARADLDRVLLVGGPTQMPILRAALESRLGAKLDHSQDPMTVVARGAAMYASTLEKPGAASTTAAVPPPTQAGVVAIQLSYERASGTAKSPVAGFVPEGSDISEVKFDADGGFWTSGWVPVEAGVFQTDVVLNDRRPSTAYTLSARNASGKAIAIDPARFSITFMLPISAPPLPHAIAVELTNVDGAIGYDRLFERHCPLPAEARRTYRADRTLRPSESDSTLPIKFWEIDVSDDPQERWWAGVVHVRAEKITRPVPEGSELEMTVKIDASRKMTVEIFVPILNESFVDGVFVPDPPAAASQLQQQLDLCFARLDQAWHAIYEADRTDLRDRVHELQLRTESIFEQFAAAQKDAAADPDAALGPTESLRKIRVQLSQIEEQCEVDSGLSQLARSLRAEMRWTDRVVADHGTTSDRAEMDRLRTQADRAIEANDARGIKYMRECLRDLRGGILDNQPWFWQNVLAFLKRPGRKFLNKSAANVWLERADLANDQQNLPALREAVSRVWELQPADQVQMAKEQAAQSGLRGG